MYCELLQCKIYWFPLIYSQSKMCMEISITTYNVAGLNDKFKRKTVWNFLREKPTKYFFKKLVHA